MRLANSIEVGCVRIDVAAWHSHLGSGSAKDASHHK
jgi:hypothetical protein